MATYSITGGGSTGSSASAGDVKVLALLWTLVLRRTQRTMSFSALNFLPIRMSLLPESR